MKKYLQKMIIPTAIMIWATWYFISVSKMKAMDSVLIRPIYIILAVLFVINSVTDFIQFRKQSKAEKDIPAEEPVEESKEESTVRNHVKKFLDSSAGKIILIFLQILLYALLMKKIGFLIVNTLFIFGVLLVMGERKVWKLIVIPIVVTVAMYAIFVLGLKVLLPKGILKGIL